MHLPCRSSDVVAALADLTATFFNAAGGWDVGPLDAHTARTQRLIAACGDAYSLLSAAKSASPQLLQEERFRQAAALMLEAAAGTLCSVVAAADRRLEAGNSEAWSGLLVFATILVSCQARALRDVSEIALAVPGRLAQAVPPRLLHAWLLASAAALADSLSPIIAESSGPNLAHLLCDLRGWCERGNSEHCAIVEADPPLCGKLASVMLAAVHSIAADVADGGPLPSQYSWAGTLVMISALTNALLGQACTQQLTGTGGAAVVVSMARLVLCAAHEAGGSGGGGGSSPLVRRGIEAHCTMVGFLSSACEAQLMQRQRQPTACTARRLLSALLPLLLELGPLLQLAVQSGAASSNSLLKLGSVCLSWMNFLGSCMAAIKAAFPRPSADAPAGEPGSAATDVPVCSLAVTGATAALRLLPQLLDLAQLFSAAAANDATLRHGDGAGLTELVDAMAGASLYLVDAVRAHVLDRTDLLAVQHWQKLQQPMWELHSTACQAVHWALSANEAEQQRRAQLLPVLGSARYWQDVAVLLSSAMHATSAVLPEAAAYQRVVTADPGLLEWLARPCRAMALAHLSAMRALHLAPHSAAALQQDTLLHPFMEGSFVAAAAAAGTAFLAIEPDAHGQISHCWGAMHPLQLAGRDAAAIGETARLVQRSYTGFLWRLLDFQAAPVAALLVTDGQLAALLRQAVQVLQLIDAPQDQAVLPRAAQLLRLSIDRLFWTILRIIGLIYRAGNAVADVSSSQAPSSSISGRSPGAAAGGVATIGQHVAALRSAFAATDLEAALPADSPSLPPNSFTTGTCQWLLTCSLPLAAALLDYWQQPEQAAAGRLEAAQATAARSCAYLRCANLGGQGGPAAGQGEGGARCSACRAVWYCGTACSHADWRQGGHRQVCKALAAARQAAKQRRQQQEAHE